MAFYKELSSLVYKPRHISDKNMASFSYNTDDFPPLPSNRTDHQLTSVYIPLKPRAQNSNVASFSNTGNPLLFEKNVFVCTSKAYFFPFKSDGIFRSDTRSPVCHVNLLFVQHLVHRVLVFLLSLLLLYVTVKHP